MQVYPEYPLTMDDPPSPPPPVTMTTAQQNRSASSPNNQPASLKRSKSSRFKTRRRKTTDKAGTNGGNTCFTSAQNTCSILATKYHSYFRRRPRHSASLAFAVIFIIMKLVSMASGQYAGVVFEGMCPVPECYCGLDTRNRLEVDCSSGGLNEIPTSRMSPHIEVIRITSPKGRANHVTIGRSFRQFKKLEELHIVSGILYNLNFK